MDLQNLVFKVDSTQLDEARIKIAKLGDAVGALNKPLQEMSRSSAKTNEIIAKSELAAEKARVATKALADTTGQVKDKVDPLAKLIEKLSNNYTDMASGFTKGESSILNQARNLGIFGSELQPVIALLEKIKTLNKDPFDASLGGVRSITQEFEKLQQRANLAAQGIMLTTKQLGEYSKLAAEAAGKVEGMGFDPKSGEGLNKYNQLLAESQNKYLEIVGSVNKLTQAEKDRNEALKQQERLLASNKAISDAMIREVAGQVGQKSPELKQMAEFYKKQEIAARQLTAAEDDLILREQKLAFVNKELAAGLSTASANALFKYQKDLEALGKSADEVSQRMSSFRAGLVEKQGYSPLTGIANDAKAAREQVDHLSRAIGVQLGDVAVSLAGGMNPFLVLIQQGDQLRFAVQAARDAGQDLEGAMKKALSGIVMSFIDTGKVIGGFFINSMLQAGKAVTDFAINILFANKTIQAHSLAVSIAADSGNKLASFLVGAFSRIPMLIGAAAGSVTIFAGIALAAFFAVEKQMKALTTSLILTGGSLGLTTDSAIRMAQSMEQVGVSSSKALDVMTVMAKQGGFTSKEIELVTKSAVQMQAELGVSVEDTVKQFAKLKEDPVNALLKVAEQTGLVNTEVLATVISLDQQGKTADATTLAMQAYGDVTVAQVQRAKQEYTEFAQLMIDIGKGLGKFWDSMKEMWISASPSNQLAQRIEYLNASINSFGIGSDYKKKLEEERTELQKKLILLQDVNFAEDQKNKMQSASSKVMAEAVKTTEKYLTGLQKLSNDRVKAENEQEQLNAQFRRGDIDQRAYNAGIAANKIKLAKIDEDIAKENKKNNADQLNEAKKIENFGKKALEESRKYIAGERAEVEQTTEAWKRYLKLEESDFWTKIPESLRSQIRLNYQLADAEERMREQRTKSQEEFMKNFGEIARLNSETYRKNTVSIQQAKEEAESIKYQASLIGLSSDEREKLLALKKIDLQTEKDINDLISKGIPLNATVIQQTRDLGQLQKDNVQAMLDLKQYEKLMSDLGDVMFLALTNRGAQAGKKLRDLIKAELMKPISVVINAAVNAIFGDAINALLAMVGVKVPGAASAAGSLGSAAGLYKTGSDVYSAATGGFAKAGTAASALTERFATSALGQKLGLSSVQSVNVPVFEAGASSASGTTMVSNNAANQTVMTESGQSLTSGIGNLATSITATLVGQALRKAISGGYKMSKGLENVSNIAGIVAGFDKTGFSQIVVGVVSGLASRAFGTKLTQTGIQGTFGGEQGFTGSRYTFEKGGWFRKDKERMQPLEQELQSGLALAFNVTKFEVQKFTDYMGVGADAIANFSYKMKLNLKGLSEADALKAIDAEFAKVKESMAAAVLVGKSYGKANETSYQTLERLATTVYSVNSIFKDLGANVLAAGYAGVDTALMFSEFFGGTDKFNASLSKFYDTFYTEAEKTANLTRNTTEAFKALGLELPSSRDAFKELVKSSINAGNPQLLSSLLSLQDAFVLLTESASVASEEVASESIMDAYVRLKYVSATTEDIAKQRIDIEQRLFEATATQVQIQAKARAEIDSYNLGIYDSMIAAEEAKVAQQKLAEEKLAYEQKIADQKATLDQRLFDATATQLQIQAKARAEIDSYNLSLYDQVIAAEKAKLVEEERLAAEKLVLEQRNALQDEYFNLTASQTEIAAKARAAIDASNLAIYDMVEAVKAAKAAEEERLVAEKLITEERLALQNRLFEATATQSEIQAKARSEINDSNKVLYDQVLAAEEASNASKQLADTMQQLADSIINEVNRLKGAILGDVGVSGGVSGLTSEFATLTAQARAGDMKAIEKLPEYSQAIEQAVASTAANASDVVYARAWLAASLGNTADVISSADTSMQSTALTSLAASTVTNGASVISSSATSQSELIAILVAEIQGLRAEVRADVSANTKTSKILERANQDGESLNVTII